MANMVCDLPDRCIDIKLSCADCEHYKAVYDPKIYKLVPLGEESESCKEAELWTRQRVLKEAEKCVCGQRDQDYGTPEDSFQRIADLWSAYFGFDDWRGKFSAVDVAIMMALLKVARIANNPGHMDSYVDGCGYFACGGEIAGKEAQEGGNGSP